MFDCSQLTPVLSPVLQDLLEANLEAAASKGRRAKKLSFGAIQEGDFDDLEEALAPGKCACCRLLF